MVCPHFSRYKKFHPDLALCGILGVSFTFTFYNNRSYMVIEQVVSCWPSSNNNPLHNISMQVLIVYTRPATIQFSKKLPSNMVIKWRALQAALVNSTFVWFICIFYEKFLYIVQLLSSRVISIYWSSGHVRLLQYMLVCLVVGIFLMF